MCQDVIQHYDLLIAEGNDPVLDPEPLRTYMDLWDGPRFLSMLALTGRENVLEIGVGTGRLALRTVPLCQRFTGLDLSPASLRRASEHLRGHPQLTLQCGDFLTADLTGPYDVIYTSLTMLHIADKAAAAKRMAALLAPRGRAVLSLDKSRSSILDYGTRQLPVFPDHPQVMAAHLTSAGLTIAETAETEFAWLIKAIKP